MLTSHRIGRPSKPLAGVAVDYAKDCEERYEAALDLLAFSHTTPRHPVEDQGLSITNQSIEVANESELEEMQQQVQKLQERISAQLQLRGGESGPRSVPSKSQNGKRATMDQDSKSKQRTEVADSADEAESTTEDNVSQSNDLDSVLETVDAAEVTDGASVNEAGETATPNVVANGVSHNCSAVPSSPPLVEANGFAPPSSGEKIAKVDEIGREHVVKAKVDHAVDAALTPPADLTKDGDELSTKLPAVKATSNGVETPETTVADQATSPVEVDGMEVDDYNLE